jgi:PAS domain-containing protein
MNALFLSESSELLDQVDVQVLLEVLSASNDACWCMEFGQPVDLTAPDHEVVRQVFENNPRWRLSNDAMAELYLLAAGENFNERPVREIFPRNMQNEEFVLALIANGFEVDRAPALDKRYDGLEIYVENDVRAHIKNGQLIRMFGIVRDVGKHRRKQVVLEAQIEGLEVTFNAMPVPVIAVSNDLGVCFVNHAAINAASRQGVDLVGSEISTLIAEIDDPETSTCVISELRRIASVGIPSSKTVQCSTSKFSWHISITGTHKEINAVLTALPLTGKAQ